MTEYKSEMTKRENTKKKTEDHKWSDKSKQKEQRPSDDL